MSDRSDIRKYMNIINEAYQSLITLPAGSTLMTNMSASDPYKAYRLMIDLANEDQPLGKTKESDNAMIIFQTKQGLDAAERLFKHAGEPYDVLVDPMDGGDELRGNPPKGANLKSPVPKNPWWGKHKK